jgi:hypothetical protein
MNQMQRRGLMILIVGSNLATLGIGCLILQSYFPEVTPSSSVPILLAAGWIMILIGSLLFVSD